MAGYSTFILVAINPTFLKTYESSNVREHKTVPTFHSYVFSLLCPVFHCKSYWTGLSFATLLMLASVYNDFSDDC